MGNVIYIPTQLFDSVRREAESMTFEWCRPHDILSDIFYFLNSKNINANYLLQIWSVNWCIIKLVIMFKKWKPVQKNKNNNIVQKI